MSRGVRPLEDRFWGTVNVGPGCWTWEGYLKPEGYGQVYADGGTRMAHRVAYELEIGPIPAGKTVDHMCHNPSCVRPDHLRLLSNAEQHQNRSGAQANSRTGIRGVSRSKRAGRWRAVSYLNGKQYYLGEYEAIEEAEKTVTSWRRQNMPYSIKDQAPLRRGLSCAEGQAS